MKEYIPVFQVATDSGELALSEVYKLIIEGENLPIHLEKELKVCASIFCVGHAIICSPSSFVLYLCRL